MSDAQVLEHDVVFSLEINHDHGPFVAQKVDLFLNVSFLDDDTRLSDRFFARVDTFNEVNGRKRLHLVKGIL